MVYPRVWWEGGYLYVPLPLYWWPYYSVVYRQGPTPWVHLAHSCSTFNVLITSRRAGWTVKVTWAQERNNPWVRALCAS